MLDNNNNKQIILPLEPTTIPYIDIPTLPTRSQLRLYPRSNPKTPIPIRSVPPTEIMSTKEI